MIWHVNSSQHLLRENLERVCQYRVQESWDKESLLGQGILSDRQVKILSFLQRPQSQCWWMHPVKDAIEGWLRKVDYLSTPKTTSEVGMLPWRASSPRQKMLMLWLGERKQVEKRRGAWRHVSTYCVHQRRCPTRKFLVQLDDEEEDRITNGHQQERRMYLIQGTGKVGSQFSG